MYEQVTTHTYNVGRLQCRGVSSTYDIFLLSMVNDKSGLSGFSKEIIGTTKASSSLLF
jgi:hypothetical protein